MSKVLFVSGSLGLGHIERDLAIAREVRSLKPGTEVYWMAGDPAREVLKLKGENVLPESETFDQGTASVEKISKNYTAELSDVAFDLITAFNKNGKLIWNIAKRNGYDLVVSDEAYEVHNVLVKNRSLQVCPCVMMTDYFGYWGPTKTIKGMLIKRIANNQWIKAATKHHDIGPSIFLCERADIPNERLGFMMPNAQELVGQEFVKFAGYPLTFDPKALENEVSLRRQHGFGNEPVILVTVGGTAAGKPLIDLSIKALPLIRGKLLDARMVVNLGPRIDPNSFDLPLPAGLELKGYVPELYKLMAACDIAICVGGATSTLELMALQKPFIYFPLQKHFEQEIIVAGRNERLGVGIKMRFSEVTPEQLAKAVIDNYGKKVGLPNASFDGIHFAGKAISALL
jgi:predicted glycosyltransferase